MRWLKNNVVSTPVFIKGGEKKSQKSINITRFTSFTSLPSPGTEFQRLHTKQSSFNYLFGWRKMDAIKLEIDKNDQFEMIKYNPQFTPYLSDLDYILQTSLCRPVCLCFRWTTKWSSVRGVVWTKTVWQREPVRVHWWKSIRLFLPLYSTPLMACESF